MLEHQIKRIQLAKQLQEIVIATTTEPRAVEIIDLAKRLGVRSFTGSENDVLDRIYQAAKANHADVVIRLTADCPLVDPIELDRLIEYFTSHQDKLDYVGTGPSFPEGLDMEIFSFEALETAWKEATKSSEREHMTLYIAMSGKFRVDRLAYPQDLSNQRWTVDEEKDFILVSAIYENLFPKHGYKFGVNDILQFLKEQPELLTLNEGVLRNEGLLESMKTERGRLMSVKKRSLERSEALWKRAKGLIPAGTQTISKSPTQYVDGVAPKYLQKGKGSHIWDVDGNEYIDYSMEVNPIILGHAYPAVNNAVKAQLEDGITFSLMHPLEVEVSEMLRDIIPCAEMVRFENNESDAIAGAIHTARAHTGREKVAHCGYHGRMDWYIGCTTRNKGVPKVDINQQFGFHYNNIDSLHKIFKDHPGEIAAVIMEPFGVTEPQDNFLQKVKDLTHKNGAVLIYDEVASGFRFHLGGIHQHFGVDPDLACFGKAMANGLPISALVGRAEVMKVLDDIFYSFTFVGEYLSLAATRTTINEMREKKVIAHLWEIGAKLQTGFNRLASDYGLQKYIECVGFAPRTFVSFKDIDHTPSLIVKSLFQQEVIKRGVLFSGAHCLTFSHTNQDIEHTLGAYQAAFAILAEAVKKNSIEEMLEGRPVQAVFRAEN